MIVRNNMDAWINVNDIGIRIPPKNKGETVVEDEKGLKSEELMSLVRGAIVNISRDRQGIHPIIVKDKKAYIVPGTEIWNAGSAQPVEHSDVPYSYEEDRLVLQEHVEKLESMRRFKLIKNVSSALMVEGFPFAFSKERPVITVDSNLYYSEQSQKVIAAGQITLIEIQEKTMDKDGVHKWVAVADRQKSGIESKLAPTGSPCCFWEGPIFDGGGYANMNRQYLFNLKELGITVRPSLVPTLMDVEEDVKKKLIEMSYNLVPLQSPKVYATNVPASHVGRVVAYTMMETENVIHSSLVQKLLVADEIWVPCEWNKRTFLAAGLKRDIHIMPLGVDHETYRPAEPSLYIGCGTKGFTFLSVFNWNWRKGFDVMLKAYIRAFSSDDDVSLVMQSRFVGQKKYSKQIHGDIRAVTAGERMEKRPHLVLIDDVMPTFLMPRLYNRADAFVLFSRGEGWGLPAIESAASGVPILTCYHGGHEMFLDDDTALLVRPDKVTKVDKSIEWISPFYHGMEFADYSEKAINEAAEKMRWMYDNRDKLAPMAARCRQNILDNFTWKHAAERVAARIREIQQ